MKFADGRILPILHYSGIFSLNKCMFILYYISNKKLPIIRYLVKTFYHSRLSLYVGNSLLFIKILYLSSFLHSASLTLYFESPKHTPIGPPSA